MFNNNLVSNFTKKNRVANVHHNHPMQYSYYRLTYKMGELQEKHISCWLLFYWYLVLSEPFNRLSFCEVGGFIIFITFQIYLEFTSETHSLLILSRHNYIVIKTYITAEIKR